MLQRPTFLDRSIAIEMEWFYQEEPKSKRLPLTFGAKRIHGRWHVLIAAGWVLYGETKRAT